MIDKIIYRIPKPGEEQQISECIGAAADVSKMTDGTAESFAAWKRVCDPIELAKRIANNDNILVAVYNEIIVGFIAFRPRNHLSLLFVRKDFAGKGIGRELFTQCIHDLDEVNLNSIDLAVGFYQKLGFEHCGERAFKHGFWVTPMKYSVQSSALATENS
jgi:ribosomal protein S18 acetylase RimI-like enzyme